MVCRLFANVEHNNVIIIPHQLTEGIARKDKHDTIINMKKRQHTIDAMSRDEMLSELALRMALHCVRNTIIEDYHSRGSISDAEMKVFNKEVVNKLYTFLHIIMNPDYSRERELALQSYDDMSAVYYRPMGWDAPEFNKSILRRLQTRFAASEQNNLFE